MNSKEVQENETSLVDSRQSKNHPSRHGNRPLKASDLELKSDECQQVCPSTSSTFPAGGTTNVSPGKKNKRKMAEPRRRITDFSIRNICSESTSSSFASEIESEGFPEKKAKIEEVGQVSPPHKSSTEEFRKFKEGAPLDVLMSLSLLTQPHNHQLHQLTLNAPSFLDIPSSSVTYLHKQHKMKSSKTITSASESKEDENKRSKGADECSDIYISVKNKLVEKTDTHESLEATRSSSTSWMSQEVRNQAIMMDRCKSELDPALINVDEILNDDATLEASDGKDGIDLKSKHENSTLQSKTDFCNTAIPLCCSKNNILSISSHPSNSNGGLQQRKNYKNMTKQRRIEANARERTRVHTISAAFESLRKAVPSYSHNQRLSKLAILRIACSYILALVKLAELESYDDSDVTSSGSSPNSLTFSQCVDLCTQTIQSEGKTKRRH